MNRLIRAVVLGGVGGLLFAILNFVLPPGEPVPFEAVVRRGLVFAVIMGAYFYFVSPQVRSWMGSRIRQRGDRE